ASPPGSVICLMGGTYNVATTFSPAHNGTSNAWIVYKAYGDSTPSFVWTAGTDYNFFGMENYTTANLTTSSSFQYLEFRGLTLKGNNFVSSGFMSQLSTYQIFIVTSIMNMHSRVVSDE